jgi:hypothetical protein
MLLIALPLHVLVLSGSALITATVFALELIPALVCAPIVGVLIDGTDPWLLMKAVAIVQAAVLCRCSGPIRPTGSGSSIWSSPGNRCWAPSSSRAERSPPRRSPRRAPSWRPTGRWG